MILPTHPDSVIEEYFNYFRTVYNYKDKNVYSYAGKKLLIRKKNNTVCLYSGPKQFHIPIKWIIMFNEHPELTPPDIYKTSFVVVVRGTSETGGTGGTNELVWKKRSEYIKISMKKNVTTDTTDTLLTQKKSNNNTQIKILGGPSHVGQIFKNAYIMSKILKLDQSNISKVLLRKTKSIKGYMIKYVDDVVD